MPCGNGAWDVPSMRGEIAGTAFSTLLPLRWDQYVLRYATETERERERERERKHLDRLEARRVSRSRGSLLWIESRWHNFT